MEIPQRHHICKGSKNNKEAETTNRFVRVPTKKTNLDLSCILGSTVSWNRKVMVCLYTAVGRLCNTSFVDSQQRPSSLLVDQTSILPSN